MTAPLTQVGLYTLPTCYSEFKGSCCLDKGYEIVFYFWERVSKMKEQVDWTYIYMQAFLGLQCLQML